MSVSVSSNSGYKKEKKNVRSEDVRLLFYVFRSTTRVVEMTEEFRRITYSQFVCFNFCSADRYHLPVCSVYAVWAKIADRKYEN